MPLLTQGPGPHGQAPGQIPEQQRTVPTFAPCTRGHWQQGKTDWITMLGHEQNFAICSGCYNHHFQSNSYSRFFVQLPPMPQAKIRCLFAQFWLRWAWIYIWMTDMQDLSLLLRLAMQTTRDGECPSHQDLTKVITAARTWYGLIDPQTNEVVTDFTVCDQCVMSIETIYPELGGLFAPVSSTPCLASCDIQTPHKRGKHYLGLLWDLNDNTRQYGYRNPAQLVQYVKRFGRLAPCPKEQPSSAPYFVLSDIPEMVACEGCHQEALMVQETFVAERGRSTTSFVPVTFGQNLLCRLYSQRMRTAWIQADTQGDHATLRQLLQDRMAKEWEILPNLVSLRNLCTQQQNQMRQYSEMAQMQNMHAMSMTVAASIGGHYGVTDFSASQVTMSKAVDMEARVNETKSQINALEAQWAQYE